MQASALAMARVTRMPGCRARNAAMSLIARSGASAATARELDSSATAEAGIADAAPRSTRPVGRCPKADIPNVVAVASAAEIFLSLAQQAETMDLFALSARPNPR